MLGGKMENSPKKFKDKYGVTIKPGDILFRKFFARWRDRPGHKRVATDRMTQEDIIVLDEGSLKDPVVNWITYEIGWNGACLIAKRKECFDFQALIQAELYDENGDRIIESAGIQYMNLAFDSTVYEILNTEGVELLASRNPAIVI